MRFSFWVTGWRQRLMKEGSLKRGVDTRTNRLSTGATGFVIGMNVLVQCRVTDDAGIEPIQCQMIWAWVPKKRD